MKRVILILAISWALVLPGLTYGQNPRDKNPEAPEAKANQPKANRSKPNQPSADESRSKSPRSKNSAPRQTESRETARPPRDQSNKANQPASRRNATEPVSRANPSAKLVVMTPAQESAALKFAKQHHPELYDLLGRLQETDRVQYQKALEALYQASDRIGRLKERSPDRYELELKIWQYDSRIRLLAARMTMSDDAALEKELETVLQNRVEVKLQLMKLDHERLSARLEKMQEQIDQIERNPDEATAKELQRIKRSLTNMRRQKVAPTQNVKRKTD